ncbi:hypothetical protein PFICI_03842 [Pestalotiopsis fici W106-1]|uniref:Uncharacterized protein n=1 Tax=Pestalotiopsis fici (strain W106-1 / CGMCC3.15140) TaxID=1229662 RepID=W3XK30_PESFW|nr:uncharacterized protein PFICI_03842 [Pestalotiopsis fici W106-1]ETS85817.1 hypothetical protein PFICI_03842 [Pestalotiopsis fici W106-1]
MNGSFVFTYVTEDNGFVHIWDLKGCYKQLEDFLRKNTGKLAVEAIALDPTSRTDYVVVTMVEDWDGVNTYDLKRKISFPSVDKKLSSWWKACAESDDTSNVYLPVTS